MLVVLSLVLVVLIIVGVDSIIGSVGIGGNCSGGHGCLLLLMVMIMVKANHYSEVQSG